MPNITGSVLQPVMRLARNIAWVNVNRRVGQIVDLFQKISFGFDGDLVRLRQRQLRVDGQI